MGMLVRQFVVFDLDGTLVDSNAICVEILQGMLDERGALRQIDAASAAQHMSLGGERMVRALLGDRCQNPSEDLTEFRARYARRPTPRDSLFDGVAEGLERLCQAGYQLAICSNKPANLCAKVLSDVGLDSYFQVVVGGGAGLRPKPAPDLLDAVLAQLGAEAEHCLFVGDSDLDYAVASAAAMPFLFLTYGYAASGWIPPDGECFDRFGDLVDRLVLAVQQPQWSRTG